jgi:hypothetical protein
LPRGPVGVLRFVRAFIRVNSAYSRKLPTSDREVLQLQRAEELLAKSTDRVVVCWSKVF